MCLVYWELRDQQHCRLHSCVSLTVTHSVQESPSTCKDKQQELLALQNKQIQPICFCEQCLRVYSVESHYSLLTKKKINVIPNRKMFYLKIVACYMRTVAHSLGISPGRPSLEALPQPGKTNISNCLLSKWEVNVCLCLTVCLCAAPHYILLRYKHLTFQLPCLKLSDFIFFEYGFVPRISS